MLCTSYPPLCIAVPRTVIIPISFVQFFFLTDSARKFKHLSLFLGCNFSVPYALSNPVYTAAIIIILLFLVATVFPRTPLARALCPFLYPNLLKMKENKKKKEKKRTVYILPYSGFVCFSRSLSILHTPLSVFVAILIHYGNKINWNSFERWPAFLFCFFYEITLVRLFCRFAWRRV